VAEDRSLTFDFTVRSSQAPAGPVGPESPVAPAMPPAPAALDAPSAPDTPGVQAPPRAEATAGRPLTVAELGRTVRSALEDGFPRDVWVEGEVTSARPAPSGHLYFCLKDEKEDASIDVVMYRSSVTPRMRPLCVDGARVRLRGKPTLWVPRGRLQLVADRMQAAGRGALLEAIERLKAKLAAEGLFAPERKRRLPSEPRIVGVVTSASGAVIHDICRVAFRRGGARVLLAPAQVQGVDAAESICRAIAHLQRVRGVDVIVVGRGGGSADDLSAFNEESVVRAVAACRVPIVAAVGHDVDVTLVDFAADARAATPSQAAEMVVADRGARADILRRTRAHLARAMGTRLAEDRAALADILRRMGDPRRAIAAHQQTLDDRSARMAASLRGALARRRQALAVCERRLAYLHPRSVVARERTELANTEGRLRAAWRARSARRANDLERASSRLDAMSPLKVLARGYAIATRGDGRAVRAAGDVRPGETIHVRVHEGSLDAAVSSVEPAGAEPAKKP
jgi:exodeoxyribonuclease VII large subunit